MDLENLCTFVSIFKQLNQSIVNSQQNIQKCFQQTKESQIFLNFKRLYLRWQKQIQESLKIFLNKIKFDVKTKKKMIDKNKKNEGRLSGYKFMLHPINGKDISTIEKELSYSRLQKLIFREEKQKKALVKRQMGQKQESRVSKILISHSVPRVNCFELEAIRVNSLDLQKFIPSNEKDHLWQAYEAKIWKQEEKSMSALQSILSKRMQRGNQILQKLNSQRSFIYDP